MKPRKIAEGIGKGLVAGVAGTAAMTVSSTIEMKIRRRMASQAPAKAASTLLGIEEFRTDGARRRFGTLVHWGYGTGWGVARGLLRAAGGSARAATALHLSAMWGGAQVMLPALDVAPPVTMWGKNEVLIDLWHHVVYTLATGLAYELLEQN